MQAVHLLAAAATRRLNGAAARRVEVHDAADALEALCVKGGLGAGQAVEPRVDVARHDAAAAVAEDADPRLALLAEAVLVARARGLVGRAARAARNLRTLARVVRLQELARAVVAVASSFRKMRLRTAAVAARTVEKTPTNWSAVSR